MSFTPVRSRVRFPAEETSFKIFTKSPPAGDANPSDSAQLCQFKSYASETNQAWFTMNILTTYMFIIIQLFTININIFVRIAFGTLKNLLRENVHWSCSVPNKLMYHGNFPLEHGHVRTRLLGTPE